MFTQTSQFTKYAKVIISNAIYSMLPHAKLGTKNMAFNYQSRAEVRIAYHTSVSQMSYILCANIECKKVAMKDMW